MHHQKRWYQLSDVVRGSASKPGQYIGQLENTYNWTFSTHAWLNPLACHIWNKLVSSQRHEQNFTYTTYIPSYVCVILAIFFNICLLINRDGLSFIGTFIYSCSGFWNYPRLNKRALLSHTIGGRLALMLNKHFRRAAKLTLTLPSVRSYQRLLVLTLRLWSNELDLPHWL